MSNTLGQLPDAAYPDCVVLPRTGGVTRDGYSYEQMEAERQRCYELGVSKASELWHSTVFAWWDSAREAACDMTATEHFAWVKVGELLRQPRVTPNVQPTPDAR